MILKDLIAKLEQADPELIVPIGFHDPHSYRGYYQDLAFAAKENVAVKDMLASAKEANGSIYTARKGGEFVMNEYSKCWLVSERFRTGEGIGPTLVDYMLKTAYKP